MLSAVMQPTFNPWMGYFDLIDQVDVFVFLDDVQLSKQSWQTRNKIKTHQGELLLSVPLKSDATMKERTINTAHMADHLDWKGKHLKSIQGAYAKSQFFKPVFEMIEQYYKTSASTVSLFNADFIRLVCERIGVQKKFVLSSELTGIVGEKDDRVVLICKAVGSDQYLSPKGSAEYINRESEGGAFPAHGIELYYHEYQHPQYQQLHGNFISHIGIIDLLFNVGFDEALMWIRKGRKDKIYFKDFKHVQQPDQA